MIEYACTNTNLRQKVKTWWIWRVISIIAENKPHAHHKTHFHTMEGFNARPVYSLAIEVFTEALTCSKVINAFKRSYRIRGPPRSGKARPLWRPVLVKIMTIKLHFMSIWIQLQQMLWTCCVFSSSLNNTFFSVFVIIFSNKSYFWF